MAFSLSEDSVRPWGSVKGMLLGRTAVRTSLPSSIGSQRQPLSLGGLQQALGGPADLGPRSGRDGEED